jgi:hypothetical protein
VFPPVQSCKKSGCWKEMQYHVTSLSPLSNLQGEIDLEKEIHGRKRLHGWH